MLYSSVSRTIRKHRQIHSALVLREPQLQYLLTAYEPCCDEHAYAVVVPMSTHVVGDSVYGDAIAGAVHEGLPVRLAFRMPIEDFVGLEMINIRRAGIG